MAQMITSTKPSIAIIPPNSKEATKLNHASAFQNVTDLTRSETGIVAKIDNIVSYLKTLEESFLKVRQDLLKKSTFEVRENDKIRAVQGKLISNKTKYYQNLEQDIEGLSQTLNSSFDKINKEFKQLQNISKASNVTDSNLSHIPNPNTNNGSPIQRSSSNFKIRRNEVPAIRNSKSGDIKAHTDTTKERPMLPFSLKVGSVQVEKVPKKVDFENFQGLANGTLMKTRTFNHVSSSLPLEKISRSLTTKSPVHSDDVSNANDVVIFDSPCNALQIKSRFYQDEKNKSTSSGSLSDSNEDFSDDDESNLKSKMLNTYLADEPTVLSLDGSRVFKF